MAESELHQRVKMAVAYWLRNQRQCSAIALEVSLGDAIVDVLGASFSGPTAMEQRRRTFLVEVKVSRADFARLIRRPEPKITLYDGRVVPVSCDYNFVAVPADLDVALSDLPEGWGLLRATETWWGWLRCPSRA